MFLLIYMIAYSLRAMEIHKQSNLDLFKIHTTYTAWWNPVSSWLIRSPSSFKSARHEYDVPIGYP